MRITSSGEVLVIGTELLVDVEAVDVGLSMVGESMAITLSWVRFPSSGSWSRVLPSIHTARPVVLVIHHKPLIICQDRFCRDIPLSSRYSVIYCAIEYSGIPGSSLLGSIYPLEDYTVTDTEPNTSTPYTLPHQSLG